MVSCNAEMRGDMSDGLIAELSAEIVTLSAEMGDELSDELGAWR